MKRSAFNHKGDCVWTTYDTTITEDELDKMSDLYNSWITEVEKLEYLDSDDETASVKEEDMEDNPSN